MSTTDTTEDTRSAAELEAAIRDGTELGITAEQLRAARDRDRLAALRAEGEQRNAERAAEKRRQAAIDALAADMAALEVRPLDDLAEAVHVALTAYLDAIDDHNDAVHGFIQRMRQVGVTGDKGLNTGTERIGFYAGVTATTVTAQAPRGGRKVSLGQIDRKATVERLAQRALGAAENERIARRRAAVAEAAANSPDLRRFFVAPNGLPLALDPWKIDRPGTPWRRQIERKELREITREQYDAHQAGQQPSGPTPKPVDTARYFLTPTGEPVQLDGEALHAARSRIATGELVAVTRRQYDDAVAKRAGAAS